MHPTLSIAIRVFNCAQRIDPLVRGLAQLRMPGDAGVELLWIDNNSTDETVACIESLKTSLPVPSRLVQELQQGATFARMRGVTEAQGQYVAFLDDDNIPHPDWLQQIVAAIEIYPQAAAFNGRIDAVTERDIPDYLQPYLPFYAIVDRGAHPFCYNQHPQGLLPPGAGLVLHRERVLAVLRDHPLQLKGPAKAGFHFKGEDIELLQRLKGQQQEIWYWPGLRINHHLSAARFEVGYLTNFLKAIARPRHYHRTLLYQPWQVPLMTLVYGVSDAQRLLAHLLRYKPGLDWQLKWTLLLYIALSPLNSLRIWRLAGQQSQKQGQKQGQKQTVPLPETGAAIEVAVSDARAAGLVWDYSPEILTSGTGSGSPVAVIPQS